MLLPPNKTRYRNMDEGSYHALEAYGYKGVSLKDMGFCYTSYSFLCEQEFSPAK